MILDESSSSAMQLDDLLDCKALSEVHTYALSVPSAALLFCRNTMMQGTVSVMKECKLQLLLQQ